MRLVLCALVVSFSAHGEAGTPPITTPASTNPILRGVAVGEVYPSGHIYLLPVVGGATFSPPQVRYTILDGKKKQPVLEKAASPSAITERYVPALEGVSENRSDRCEYVNRDADQYRGFFGSDYFDSCEVSSPTRYDAVQKPQAPALVFSFAAEIDVDRVDVSAAGKRRPLTPSEKPAVDAERKAELARSADCTTEPRFLDEATELATFFLRTSNQSIRVSRYRTPGCGGHVVDVYVVDLLEGKSVTATATHVNYRGNA